MMQCTTYNIIYKYIYITYNSRQFFNILQLVFQFSMEILESLLISHLHFPHYIPKISERPHIRDHFKRKKRKFHLKQPSIFSYFLWVFGGPDHFQPKNKNHHVNFNKNTPAQVAVIKILHFRASSVPIQRSLSIWSSANSAFRDTRWNRRDVFGGDQKLTSAAVGSIINSLNFGMV